MTQQQVIVGGIILAVVAGALGFFAGRNYEQKLAFVSAPALENTGELSENLGTTAADLDMSDVSFVGGNAVATRDQAPGAAATVQMLTLAEAGWVAIHREQDGKPGGILGAQWYPAGTREGMVELLTPTEEGRVYFAVLHSDDGDRVFDKTKDTPLLDTQGNMIMMRFVATASSAL